MRRDYARALLADGEAVLESHHARDGAIFRLHAFGGDNFFVSDVELAKQVLTDESLSAYAANLHVGAAIFGEPLLYADGDRHRRLRAAQQPLYSPGRVRAVTPLIDRVMQAEFARWQSLKAIDLNPAARRLALDLTCRHALNLALDRSCLDQLVGWLYAMGEGLYARNNLRIPGTRFHSAMAARRRLRRFLATEVDLDGTGRHPLVDVVRSSSSKAEVVDEIAGTLFAGTVTTGPALVWLAHRVLQGRASTGQWPFEDHQKLIQDVLATWPPAHLVPRMALAETRVGGMTIPAAAIINVNLLSLCRAHRAGLGAKPGSHRTLYFGFGPKRCIGAPFAVAVMRAFLACLRGYPSMRLASDDPPSVGYVPVLGPASPVMVYLNEREGSNCQLH